MLKIEGITHWSIGVRDLEESERFYRDLLGLEYRGRLGSSKMCCFSVGGQDVLLCESPEARPSSPEDENRVHHSFTVSAEEWEKGVRLFKQHGVPLAGPIVYRERGFFPGRELYFLDPSGNVLELRDPSWQPGMPAPAFEDIAAA